MIEGAVNFKIHETSMILATGGMFMVPRGKITLTHKYGRRRVDMIRLQETPILLKIFANEMRDCSSLKLGRW